MQNSEVKQLAKKYGYLLETIERFVELFGFDDTSKMLESYEHVPLEIIRVNTLKITPEELKERMEKKGFGLLLIEGFTNGFIVKKEPYSIGATTEYLSGYYFIQSQASWLPTLLLNPQESDVVIDLAAAPGGKATHLAQLMKNKGTLLCFDISRERMKSLRSNLARCGVINTICFRMDGTEITKLNLKTDKILLDAPCSGEGLMAIDRTRRTNRTVADITRMAILQKNLLTAALKSLKKNGTLVYSTCSTAPEENEEVIDWALTNYPVQIVEEGLPIIASKGLTQAFGRFYDSSLEKAKRLYPHIHKTEGFFVCKLRLLEEVNE